MIESSNRILSGYCIEHAPSAMYYIPNFITGEEEAAIMRSIPPTRWVSLSNRRLQALPARLTATNTLVASTPLPAWLTEPVVGRIHDLGVFADAPHGINHCLINEYLPGQGIMPHEDGPAYHPVTATVSLGGTTVLSVTDKRHGEGAEPNGSGEVANPEPKTYRFIQEPRSLLLITGAAYRDTLHGIADVTEDVDLRTETVANWKLLGDKSAIATGGGRSERRTRISLTFRDVKKVSSIGSKIFGKAKG
ncbi:hypothetical protein BAUCODRAFT_196023 [Baudoinia panamericana UAMH 10762]|uniref:Fe2OG dioxygenase domain-containing protein n=1 Tax=Baudoinia panamericana (strain UAMH 10762) TaxID=717646 RepID=M2NA66_BAUPA|nr:uncharacterized protein BAUCODRAFT_196023 [Baudoinia panamericana UAMH 10762]EMD01114.1 hypothetical protein BAUCODRAFT_196023 [Baudoinia panamericana UAMH 10762]